MLLSGNHGRSNEAPAAVTHTVQESIDAVQTIQPRQSNQGFTPPGTAVRAVPSIRNVVTENTSPTTITVSAPPATPAPTVSAAPNALMPTVPNISENASAEEEITPSSAFTVTTRNNSFDAPAPSESSVAKKEVTFDEVWKNGFEKVYKSVPIVYLPLKDMTPKVDGGVVTFSVKNNFQEEQATEKLRELLHYLRTHAPFEVKEVQIKVEEDLKIKKVYFDEADKLKMLHEANPDFNQFIQILGLQVEE